MDTELQLKNSQRTEELQSIIDRMPTTFGYWISAIVIFICVVLVVFGYIVKYPDLVKGQVTLNANTSPIRLVASTSGNINLLGHKPDQMITKGEYIAFINNSANLGDIVKLRDLLKAVDPNNLGSDHKRYPNDLSLGELNSKYANFINAYIIYTNFLNQNLLSKEEEMTKHNIIEQQSLLNNTNNRLSMSEENLKIVNKFYTRDSILYTKKVLTLAEIDRSEMNLNSASESYHTMLNDVVMTRERIFEATNKLQQLSIQKSEKSRQTRLNLIIAYTELYDSLKDWEQKYVFKAPMKGKIQFSKFWTNDQFIQIGEPIFTIVPVEDKIIGQMVLPAAGAGKVKVGQDVVVKLDNYPYTEYGSIKGKIASISMTTNVVKSAQGELETYLVNVNFPEGLKTNYGSKLGFKFQIKGTGEIITNDRRLAERLFDNINYILKKK